MNRQNADMVGGRWAFTEIEEHALEGLANAEYGVTHTMLPKPVIETLKKRNDPPGSHLIAMRVKWWHVEQAAKNRRIEFKHRMHDDPKFREEQNAKREHARRSREFNTVAVRAHAPSPFVRLDLVNFKVT